VTDEVREVRVRRGWSVAIFSPSSITMLTPAEFSTQTLLRLYSVSTKSLLSLY
jgi:hypothetical protein